jgi:hypothetical protein
LGEWMSAGIEKRAQLFTGRHVRMTAWPNRAICAWRVGLIRAHGREIRNVDREGKLASKKVLTKSEGPWVSFGRCNAGTLVVEDEISGSRSRSATEHDDDGTSGEVSRRKHIAQRGKKDQ